MLAAGALETALEAGARGVTEPVLVAMLLVGGGLEAAGRVWGRTAAGMGFFALVCGRTAAGMGFFCWGLIAAGMGFLAPMGVRGADMVGG